MKPPGQFGRKGISDFQRFESQERTVPHPPGTALNIVINGGGGKPGPERVKILVFFRPMIVRIGAQDLRVVDKGGCRSRVNKKGFPGQSLEKHREVQALEPAGDAYSINNLRYGGQADRRSEEHTSELQSLMRISYAVFCLKKKKKQ